MVGDHIEELAALEVANSGHPIGAAEWEAGQVRDVLQFSQHKFRYNDITFYESCFQDIRNPSVDNDARVQNLWRSGAVFSFCSPVRISLCKPCKP